MKPTLLAALLITTTTALSAEQISTLATLALEAPLRAVAEEFKQQTGHTVTLNLDTSPNITRRLASGEKPDVLVATASTIDDVIKDGKANPQSRARIGKIGLGVAVSRGGRRSDTPTPDALKTSLLQADGVLYSQGASGLLVEQLFRELGVTERIQSRLTRLATGGDIMKRLGEGRGTELGFTMVSEIRQGESYGGSLIGAVPGELQSYTTYDAVVMSTAGTATTAQSLIGSLTGATARKLLASAGWVF